MPAFRVMHAGDAVAADSLQTRIGGLPLLPSGSRWPTCVECGRDLGFMGQVDLADLTSAGADRPVLALFHCVDWCVQDEPQWGWAHAAFLHPRPGLVAVEPPEQPERTGHQKPNENMTLAPVGIRFTEIEVAESADPDWEPGDPPGPTIRYHDGRGAWVDREGRSYEDFLGRLGGEPDWVQGDDTPIPACSECGRDMRFVAQFDYDSRYSPTVDLGDFGYGYVFACEPCSTGAFHVQD